MNPIEQFLYREARYADELQYDAWESLWTDDATYWVPAHHPANGDDPDPTRHMSIIFDNRQRISTRVKQLHTGKRHAQNPPSRLRRMLSNIELLDADPDFPGDTVVGANFLIYESRERGLTIWGGRCIYRLREVDGELKMAFKKVMLVDNDKPLNTLAFLV